MKKLALSAVVLLSGIIAYGQGSKVTGFRNLVWGTHKDSAKVDGVSMKFKKDKKAGEPNAFMVEGDKLTLGAAKLTSINYYFNADNRFKKVVMKGDTAYYGDIDFIVKHKFGNPSETEKKGTLTLLTWREGDVSLRLTRKTNEDNFLFLIESNWDITETFVKNNNVKDIPFDGKEVLGFRTMKWLDEKDKIYMNGEKVNFTLDREADQPNTYYIANDNRAIGSAKLDDISYVFNENDKLNKVIITGQKEYFGDMKMILDSKFGKADGVNTFSTELSVSEWRIKGTTVKLTESDRGDGFTCIIESSKDKTEKLKKNMEVFDF